MAIVITVSVPEAPPVVTISTPGMQGVPGMIVSPTDPGPSLPQGTEYFWIRTDGAGTFIDMNIGVA